MNRKDGRIKKKRNQLNYSSKNKLSDIGRQNKSKYSKKKYLQRSLRKYQYR